MTFLIHGKTWQSICNALKRKEMNLQGCSLDGSAWQPFLHWGADGVPEPQPGEGWLEGCFSLLP